MEAGQTRVKWAGVASSVINHSVPNALSSAPLKKGEIEVDGKIRTASLAIIATTCICFAVYKLKAVLVPFVLAVALKFLLTPIINVLSCANCSTPGNCKLPRGLAIIFSFVVVIYGGSLIVTVVTGSAATFMANSDMYTERMTQLLDMGFEYANNASSLIGREPASLETVKEELQSFMKTISISDIILEVLGSVGHIAENFVFIMLFLAFLLHDDGQDKDKDEETAEDKLASAAEQRVHRYIRGKVTISLGVSTMSACIYFFLGVELWHVFGLLSFWLNFIPNVGMIIACILPMPLIALDPAFTPLAITTAFVAPLAVGTIGKDVFEPLLVGNAVALQPIAVMFAILLWSTAWGITGAILAVPLTAVLRIYLAGIHHPLPRYMATCLTGEQVTHHSGAELL